jgi:hypothetical protein
MSSDYEEQKKRLNKIMLVMSFSFPLAVAICIFFRLIAANYRKGYFSLALTVFLLSGYLGWYLYRRSSNKRANIWFLSVDPNEWGPFDIPTDWLVTLTLSAIFMFSIFAT